MRRVRLIVFLGALLVLPAVARGDAAPAVDFYVEAPGPVTVGAGEPFPWLPLFGIVPATGGQSVPVGPFTIKWTADLPGGVKLVHSGWAGNPGLLDNCLSNCPFVWSGTFDRQYDYTLVAPAPGDYGLTVRIVSTSDTDPDLSNNTGSTDVKVVPLQIKLAALSQSHAQAGKRLTWTVEATSRVTGFDIRADRATCSGRLGSKAITGKASLSIGKITCGWRVPANAGGKKFRATVHASLAAASTSISRSFQIARS